MKKIICILIIFVQLSAFCFAETALNVQKYNDNKINISLKTQEPYDIENYTAYAEYEPISLSNRGTKAAKIKADSEWIILRGDGHRLFDVNFLRLVEDKEKLAKVEKMLSDEWAQVFRGAAFSTVGLLLFFTASNNASQFALAGVLLGWGAFEYYSGAIAVDKQHIEPLYAAEKAYEYNLKLKEKYGLP